MFDDVEWHLKVISGYVVIPTFNISDIIYDTSTETEIANKNKKLTYCWETVRRESMPRIAEMDVEMTT